MRIFERGKELVISAGFFFLDYYLWKIEIFMLVKVWVNVSLFFFNSLVRV